MHRDPHTTLVTQEAPITTQTHGGRAKCLQRLVRLNLPVPPTVALSFAAVKELARGQMPDIARILSQFPQDGLMCVRPSSEDPDWGGPSAILNIGMNDARFADLRGRLGTDAACALYARFVQAYAVHVARLDPDMFDDADADPERGLQDSLRAYEEEAEEPFPQDPGRQLADVLKSMARAWEGTSARLLRQAKGAPADAGLGLVVQKMVFGFGPGECGSGVLQRVDSQTGKEQITGRYLPQSQGREALQAGAEAYYLTKDPRGPSLEERAPQAFGHLIDYTLVMRTNLREEMQIEFVLHDGAVHIVDGVRVSRSARAALPLPAGLAEDGWMSHADAVMPIPPRLLT